MCRKEFQESSTEYLRMGRHGGLGMQKGYTNLELRQQILGLRICMHLITLDCNGVVCVLLQREQRLFVALSRDPDHNRY